MIDNALALSFAAALAAGACYDTGYALQALEARSVHARHALRPSLLLELVRRPRWVGATVLSLAGWPLQVFALTLAPLTLVQPTLALGLLLLLFLGARLLGEHVGRREVTAVLAIVAGVGVVAWAAPGRPPAVEPGLGLAVALAILGALTLAPYLLGARRRSGSLLLVLGAAAADGAAAFMAKLVADGLVAGRSLEALAWAVATGLAVSLGVLSEMTALQRTPATRVAPGVLVAQISIPVALAPLVGGENWGATPLGGAVLVAGLLAVAAGVGILGRSHAVADVIGGARGERSGAG
jgi:drug/metabolite transporter (DMT)-like permease